MNTDRGNEFGHRLLEVALKAEAAGLPAEQVVEVLVAVAVTFSLQRTKIDVAATLRATADGLAARLQIADEPGTRQ